MPKKSLPKNAGFEIPKTYFEEFKEQLDARLYLNDLFTEDKEQGYKVPELYFEKNMSIVNDTVHREHLTKQKVLHMSKILYASISIAATISIVFFFLPNSKPSIDMIGVDSIAIQSYLEEDNLENIEFDTEWFTISNNTSLLLDDINSSQNSIVDYLQQETDLTDLIIN